MPDAVKGLIKRYIGGVRADFTSASQFQHALNTEIARVRKGDAELAFLCLRVRWQCVKVHAVRVLQSAATVGRYLRTWKRYSCR
jgi:hypothetical protein